VSVPDISAAHWRTGGARALKERKGPTGILLRAQTFQHGYAQVVAGRRGLSRTGALEKLARLLRHARTALAVQINHAQVAAGTSRGLAGALDLASRARSGIRERVVLALRGKLCNGRSRILNRRSSFGRRRLNRPTGAIPTAADKREQPMADHHRPQSDAAPRSRNCVAFLARGLLARA
jgi:hypothetical protein